jgi:hypothetical protein
LQLCDNPTSTTGLEPTVCSYGKKEACDREGGGEQEHPTQAEPANQSSKHLAMEPVLTTTIRNLSKEKQSTIGCYFPYLCIFNDMEVAEGRSHISSADKTTKGTVN